MDSDKVLVMDAGCVIDFGHAYDLLTKGSEIFKNLVDQTGSSTAQMLTDIARAVSIILIKRILLKLYIR